MGAPSNACQNPDRQPKVKGQDPCPLLEKHGGIWKFDENKLDQTQDDGARFATGLRQMPAIAWHDGALYIVMNNRDQLDIFWPDMFTAKENAERPAEPMYRAVAGSNFGWPYCFFDYGQQKFLLNPEYGGDGKTVGRCTDLLRRSPASPRIGRRWISCFTPAINFPRSTKAARSLHFTARGIARPCRWTATT